MKHSQFVLLIVLAAGSLACVYWIAMKQRNGLDGVLPLNGPADSPSGEDSNLHVAQLAQPEAEPVPPEVLLAPKSSLGELSVGSNRPEVDSSKTALEGALQDAHRFYQEAREKGLPDLVVRAYMLDQVSIVAILDSSGQFEQLSEAGIHVTEGPPDETTTVANGRAYKITELEFPGFHELKKQARSNGSDLEPESRERLIQQAEDRYQLAQASIAGTPR